MSNGSLDKKEQQQQQQQRYFPRISSWTSSLSSFAQHRPQIVNNSTTVTTLSAHHHHHYHNHQSTTSFPASGQQQHRTRQFIQGPWWSSLYRRSTVAPEKQITTTKEKQQLDSKRNTMIDSNNHHHHHRRQSINNYALVAIAHQPQLNAAAVMRGGPLIKSWLRHPFDWVNDAARSNGNVTIHQEEQDKQHSHQSNQKDDHPTEGAVVEQSPDQCSSISSSSRSSITSTISTASTMTSTCVTFNDSCCSTITTSDANLATAAALTTEESRHLQKADVVLHWHHAENNLQLLTVWIVTHLLLQTALCMTLTSSWKQKQHDATTTTMHEPQQQLHDAKQSKVKHHKQQKNSRSAAITENSGGNTTAKTTGTTLGGSSKRVYTDLRTALASFAASPGITVATPECWPPLTGSKIISDTVQALGPHMVTLWAEHEQSMTLYKERFPVRPTERRDHMRKQRRYHHRHQYYGDDYSPSRYDCYSTPESQVVMDLARDALEYFEQWYGSSGSEQQRVNSAEMKTIHWLRQVTTTVT